MKRSLSAICILLAAACGDAAQQAQEPATAAPTSPMQQAAPQLEPQQGTSSAGAPAAGADSNTVGQSEAAPNPGGATESYESCMARVNQGSDRGTNTTACAGLPDAPK